MSLLPTSWEGFSFSRWWLYRSISFGCLCSSPYPSDAVGLQPHQASFLRWGESFPDDLKSSWLSLNRVSYSWESFRKEFQLGGIEEVWLCCTFSYFQGLASWFEVKEVESVMLQAFGYHSFFRELSSGPALLVSAFFFDRVFFEVTLQRLSSCLQEFEA